MQNIIQLNWYKLRNIWRLCIRHLMRVFNLSLFRSLEYDFPHFLLWFERLSTKGASDNYNANILKTRAIICCRCSNIKLSMCLFYSYIRYNLSICRSDRENKSDEATIQQNISRRINKCNNNTDCNKKWWSGFLVGLWWFWFSDNFFFVFIKYCSFCRMGEMFWTAHVIGKCLTFQIWMEKWCSEQRDMNDTKIDCFGHPQIIVLFAFNC